MPRGDHGGPIDHTGRDADLQRSLSGGIDRDRFNESPHARRQASGAGGQGAESPVDLGDRSAVGSALGCDGGGEGASFRSDVGQQSVFGIRWAPRMGFAGRWDALVIVLGLKHAEDRAIGGELSKREGVLFHWWPFSSKRNDRLQLFYTDISLI